MPTRRSSNPRAGPRLIPRPGAWLAAAVLALATLAVHAWALGDGTVLDDHWHQRGLREYGWSYAELMRTLVIEPADFMQLWWQEQPVRWEYGRPVFILAMKLVYHVLGGDDPAALHAFSLVLHYVSALLVCRLAFLLTRRIGWSLLGALLFVVYPHAIVTVAWPSSQNVVLVTPLMLGALLCYRRASGTTLGASAEPGLTIDAPRMHARWFAASLLLWIVALFARENALIIPPIALCLELAAGGWRRCWARRGAWVAFALLGAGFIAWRLATSPHPMPDVYVRRPDGDWAAYLPWLAAKLVHYLCTSLWIAPMTLGPTGRYDPWSEAPLDYLFMTGIVAVAFVLYALATRRTRGWWIWPLWILLAVLPVIPVVATPHSGYLSGVGYALGAALAASGVGAASRVGRAAARGVCCASLAGMLVFAMFTRWQWTATIAAERFTPSWVAADPPAPAVRDVFFIDVPFVNIYLKPTLVELLGAGFEEKRVHALTFSPDWSAGPRRAWIEQNDERSFTVGIEGRPYFSGLLGRFLIEGFRGPGRFRAGDVIEAVAPPRVGRADSQASGLAPRFQARIDAADEQGVRRIAFRFPKPLDDPSYCFYFVSERCGAARLVWDGPMADSVWDRPMAGLSTDRRMTDSVWDRPMAVGHAQSREDEVRNEARDRPLSDAVWDRPTEPSDQEQVWDRPTEAGDQEQVWDRPMAGLSADRRMTDSVWDRPMAGLSAPLDAAEIDRAAYDLWTGDAQSAHTLLAAMRLEDERLARRAYAAFAPVGVFMAESLGSRACQRLDAQPTPADVDAIEAWWRRSAAPRLADLWLRQDEFGHLIKAREELEHSRIWAGRVIRSDLYLTGAPFPGPR